MTDGDQKSWKELEVKGEFLLHIPPGAVPRIEPDGATVAIRLGKGEEATEILIANYGLGKSCQDTISQCVALRETVAQFFEAVRRASGHEVTFNIEVTEESDENLYHAQGVAEVEKGIWCLARVYARLAQDRFWILHWNGPAEVLKSDVLRIFISFKPA